MSAILLPTLYGLSGVCAYAGLHHGLIAWRRPVERTHLLFSLLCLAVVWYVLAKAGAYQADSAQEVVARARWMLSAVTVFFALLPWFVGEYTGVRPHWLLAGFSAFMIVMLVANATLPYGMSFIELPRYEEVTLPWGEQVANIVDKRSGWMGVGRAGVLLIFLYCFYACVRQYRRGRRRRALILTLGMGLLLVSVLFNWVVVYGFIRFSQVAEFGFFALILVMNQGLIHELRKSEQDVRAVLDNVPAVIYLKDLEGRYIFVNRHFENRFHVTNATVGGKTDYDLFPPAQADAFVENDRLVLRSRTPLEVEERADKNGEMRVYTSLKFPLLYPDGMPYGTGGVSTDITAQRKAEQETRRLRRQVWHSDRVARTGALTASLSHELNQPLAAILSNAQAGLRFLARDNPDLEEVRAILEDIVRDDKRAAAVISGLRAMVRRQDTDTDRQRIDLAAAVCDILDLVHSELLGWHVAVETDLEAGCPVLADKVQIQQVVLNLVMNAIEAMHDTAVEQRRLQLAVRRSGKETVQVSIRDSGPGIPAKRVKTVFDAFWTNKAQGMGLGLAVCRSIVEAHGGSMRAVNNDDGPGATFFFELPIDTGSGLVSGAAVPPPLEARSA